MQYSRIIPSCIVAAIASCAGTVYADTPAIYMDDATLTGASDTVTVERVPVSTATGQLVYLDITTAYVTDGNGNLAIAPGYPLFVPSKNVLNDHFMPGQYVTTINGTTYHATLGGPGVKPDGTTVWSFISDYLPVSATWYVTRKLSNNPEYSRLKSAGIFSTAYSYGVEGSHPSCDDWGSGGIVGAAQSGSTLTISPFTYCGNEDHSAPIDNSTWVLSK